MSSWTPRWFYLAVALVLAVWIYVLNELLWSTALLEGTAVG